MYRSFIALKKAGDREIMSALSRIAPVRPCAYSRLQGTPAAACFRLPVARAAAVAMPDTRSREGRKTRNQFCHNARFGCRALPRSRLSTLVDIVHRVSGPVSVPALQD